MPRLYVSNKDESPRLFSSPLLECLTHVHWTVPMILYLPVVGWCLWRAGRQDLGAAQIAAWAGAGMAAWTLAEYLLHRFVFHYEPRSRWGRRLHFLMHGIHHDYPNDSTRLVMPPAVSAPLAAVVWGLCRLSLPGGGAEAFFAGFVLGYVCYDEIHYMAHHAPMRGRLGLWIKHHHIRHHYLDNGRGFGVSTPLWDYVFGTTYTSADRSVPLGGGQKGQENGAVAPINDNAPCQRR